VKTKGISGDVVTRTKITTDSIKEEERFVMVEINGLFVPFFAESWHNISKNEIVLKFKSIDTKDKAENFRDRKIWLHRDEFKRTLFKPTLQDLVGYKIIDTSEGFIGIAKGMLEIPGNELLQVDYGDRELLIPLQEGIVLEINPDKKQIRVSLPDGFLQI